MSFYSHIDEPELKYSAVNCNCIKDLYSLALGTYRQYIKENLILGLSKDLARLYLNRDLKSQTTDEEREKFQNLMDSGFIDTYRYLYPNQEGIYSWWSYRFKAREKNAGWRIDYFLVSDSLKNNIKEASIHTDIFGSDHCPVEVVLEL